MTRLRESKFSYIGYRDLACVVATNHELDLEQDRKMPIEYSIMYTILQWDSYCPRREAEPLNRDTKRRHVRSVELESRESSE